MSTTPPTNRPTEMLEPHAWGGMSFQERMATAEFRIHHEPHIVVDGKVCADCSTRECVVACLPHSDDTTFKVFKHEDGRQWLAPLNPQHPTIHEPFHILGTVIGKWEDI